VSVVAGEFCHPLGRCGTDVLDCSVLVEQDDARCLGGVRSAHRADQQGSAEALGHGSGDPGDEPDLLGVEGGTASFPEHPGHPPDPGVGDEDRPQLLFQSERPEDLAVASAALRLPAGLLAQDCYRAWPARELGEEVEVLAEQLDLGQASGQRGRYLEDAPCDEAGGGICRVPA